MSSLTNGGLVFISQASVLVKMHPQTVRLYENAGLVEPIRTAGGTRLYNAAHLDRLCRIKVLSNSLGISIEGIKAIFALEDKLSQCQSEGERQRRAHLRREKALLDEIAELSKKQPHSPFLPVRRDYFI